MSTYTCKNYQSVQGTNTYKIENMETWNALKLNNLDMKMCQAHMFLQQKTVNIENLDMLCR